MAKYSIAIYGKSKYGQTSPNQANYTVPFSASSNWYYSTFIEWGALVEDLANVNEVSHWMLVRSGSGVPDNPYLAEYVTGGEYRDSEGNLLGWPNYYTDNYENATNDDRQPLEAFLGGSQIIYSLWVFAKPSEGVSGKWIMVGYDTAYVVSHAGNTLRTLLKGLPGSWTNSSTSGYLTGEPEVNDLATFLSGFAFYYDELKAKISSLAAYSNPLFTPVEVLRASVLDLGFEDEPTLGDTYHRSIFKVGNYVNAYKGTELGVRTFTTALTHWGNEIYLGNNLMLDYNCSSFEDSLGDWVETAGTLDLKAYANFTTTSNEFSRVILSPINDLSFQRTDGFYARTVGFAKLTLDGSGAAEITCGDNSPASYGIPVSPGTAYEFSVYAQHGTFSTAASIVLGVNYYNGVGTLRYNDELPIFGDLTDSWQRFTHTTAPINIESDVKYASVYIGIVGGDASGNVLLDMASFGVAGTQDQFQDARKVIVSLYGERENLLPNPGFEHSDSGWATLNSNGSIVQDIEPPAYALYYGTNVGKVIASDVDCSVSSTWIPVIADSPVTFSAYVSSDTDAKLAKLRLEFSTPKDLIDQAKINNGVFDVAPYYVDSAEFTLSNITSTRVSLTAMAPDTNKYGIKPSVKASIIFTDSATDEVFYIDGCLLEHTGYLRPFFEGSGAAEVTNPNTDPYISSLDCGWEYGFTTNYVQNPTFASDASGWTNVTRSSSAGKFGTGYGTVSLGDTASTSISLPADFEAGAFVTFSAYVRGASNYTLVINGDVPATVTSTHSVSSIDWVRISSTTTVTGNSVGISLSADAAFDIDGAQFEPQEYATSYTGPGADGVISSNDGSVYTHTKWGSLEAGRSFFWTNFETKATRLNATLEKVLPIGSSWELEYGNTLYRNTENQISVLKMYSFDASLVGWAATADKFYRNVFAGTLADDTSIEGTSVAVLEGSAAGVVSMISDPIRVSIDKGYHACAAVRTSDTADVTLNVNLYSILGSGPTSTKTYTVSPTSTTDWYYLDIDFNSLSNFFVDIEVTSDLSAAGTLEVDRVILRSK